MKLSLLCNMIQEAIINGRYPLSEEEKRLSNTISIRSKSQNDDLNAPLIQIEVRIKEMFVINGYVSNIQHLPGVIETDILDSFRMLCRRTNRIEESDSRDITIKKNQSRDPF